VLVEGLDGLLADDEPRELIRESYDTVVRNPSLRATRAAGKSAEISRKNRPRQEN
jgi:hypothetical protein